MLTVRNAGAAALFVFLPFAGTAQALDPDAAARAFLSPGQSSGAEAEISWDTLSMDGSDIVLDGVRVAIKSNGSSTGNNTIQQIRLSDVTENGNGQYAASGAVYTNMTMTVENSVSFTVPEARMTALRTRDSSKDKLPMPVTYESAESQNISIDIPDQNVKITIADVRMDMGDFKNDVPTSGSLNVTGISVPLSAFPPGPSSPAALGYEKNFVFNVSANGTARPETSGFALKDLTFSGADVGTLSLSLDLDNYPNFANVAEPNPLEMMSMTLKGVAIKYVDDSLAVRVLDLLAQSQGMQRQEYAKQLSAALPFMLMAINNPRFQDQVVSAADSFLTEPGTIEIMVNPSKPISAEEIVGLAQTAPQTLPDVLNVTIEAK